MNSKTEEDYLKVIYKLVELDGNKTSTKDIAEKMGVKASSVTDMLIKLAEKKLIDYEKYQGVNLTAKGKSIAISIVRKHRLWEVFLVKNLDFKWNEVHDIAEQLEHIKSEELINRMDKFLGHPKFDPHGDPIPDENGKIKSNNFKPLSTVEKDQPCVMTGVIDHSSAFLQYLDLTGVKIGNEIQIVDIVDYDKSIKVLINKKEIFLSHSVSKNILVKSNN